MVIEYMNNFSVCKIYIQLQDMLIIITRVKVDLMFISFLKFQKNHAPD
jgi:hypothetical protein